MKYHEVAVLSYLEVNDMDYDYEGRVVVCGTDNEAYFLFADSSVIAD
ncbi:hypothetical protein HQN90_05230 [Paenibacillus alba]|nr:hypothetical protein [Paenibacillus alba]NQX65525.1 hypothetical protein [Paenibacillus alba]